MRSITYKSSGVNIAEANRFVDGIGGLVKATHNPSVILRKGSFGGLFSFDPEGYQSPVMVSSTDGVGTKLLIAQMVGKHDTVGIDLVAMNVNDILCVGAKPLFFLDYIACGRVETKVLKAVIKGIAEGCLQSGCSLVGGETAEMPGMYKRDEYDLAGFVVGVVDKGRMIDGSKIQEGDVVIGLPSSGLHSNGFSLVRKVFSKAEQKRLAKELLNPTRIYVKEVLPLLERFSIHGIAHITGGAFYEKLTKILPEGYCFLIEQGSWLLPKIFQKIQEKGKIKPAEMFRTFNMGIGMTLVVHPDDVQGVRDFLRQEKMDSFVIGRVIKDAKQKVKFVTR
ncbi:MAG: phosphoribosylformylglycinamidine cyclo-ligase [Candidatus Omnitrophica bacterium]|nr:phosphoribosylformylglycinamidine cyclo-ligase [Candidatus Omnitrophota bacterium]